MSNYISFNFTDGDNNSFPIIVRIENEISNEIYKEIDIAIQNRMDEYIEKQEYWDCDDILVDEVMKKYADKYKFNYEFVSINYNINCD